MEDEVKKMDINKLANEGNAKCSECGRKDITLTILVDANTGQAERKCLVCMDKSTPSELKEKDLDRINDDIKRYEDKAKKYEQLISEFDILGIPTA